MKEQRCHCSDKHKHYRWDASQPPAANPWNTCRAGPRFGPEFLSCGSKRRAGLAVCLCVCSSPASCSSAVSTRPPSSRQTCGTQPRCHSAAQAPQWLRFPLGLTEVFAVFHIVGIQHQPVYWSPCGSSLSLPSSSFLCACFFPLSTTYLLYMACVSSFYTKYAHSTPMRWNSCL